MNSKQAKRLRRFLRMTGLDPKEARYNWVVRVEDGQQIPIKRLLHPDSGRAVYRKLKPLWA